MNKDHINSKSWSVSSILGFRLFVIFGQKFFMHYEASETWYDHGLIIWLLLCMIFSQLLQCKDMSQLQPRRLSWQVFHTNFIAGWLYGSFNGKMGMLPEDTIKPEKRKDISRQGSFIDTRSRHSSGKVWPQPHYIAAWLKLMKMGYSCENMPLNSVKSPTSMLPTKCFPGNAWFNMGMALRNMRSLKADCYSSRINNQKQVWHHWALL